MNFCLLSFVMLFVAIRYTSASGGYKWDTYPACQAKRQSPINIEDSETKMDKKLQLVTKNWSKTDVKMNLTNKGHTVQVNIIDAAGSGLKTEFEGETYEPVQFHFHWGKVSWKSAAIGSEHTINGKPLAAELHIVHYNTKYADLTASLGHGDGVLVVGVFIQGGATNPAMADITSHLHKVSTICDGDETKVCKGGQPVHLSLSQLLPKDGLKAFYHYDGSLTTPPCSEAVNWIVCRTPITMDEAQFSEFRSLHSTESGNKKTEYMSGNYRETQKLWGRVITRNFVPEEPEVSSGVNVIPGTFIAILAAVVAMKTFLY